MCDRRKTDPSLTEAELARVCAAYPELKIARDPSGIIVVSRKPACDDNFANWLLSRRGSVSTEIDLENDGPRVGSVSRRSAQDTGNLQALEALRDRLARERETSEGVHATALDVAISGTGRHWACTRCLSLSSY